MAAKILLVQNGTTMFERLGTAWHSLVISIEKMYAWWLTVSIKVNIVSTSLVLSFFLPCFLSYLKLEERLSLQMPTLVYW